MKNELALQYVKALSGALAKKNAKSLLKPKVEAAEEVASDDSEISLEDLDALMTAEEEKEGKTEV